MRWTIAAAMAVAAIFSTTGCQDQQARTENQQLRTEIEALKNKQSGNGDDAFKQWLLAQSTSKSGGDLELKVNSLSEDIRAGLDDIKKDIEDAEKADDKRIDDLEGRLDKVSDLETTIGSLKKMIETLETQVKGVDPNEVLSVHKDLINKEAELEREKLARAEAETQVENLKADIANLEGEVQRIKSEMVGLSGEDISQHPMYREMLKAKNKAERDLANSKTDYDNLKLKYDELEAQLRKGSNPPKEDKPLPDNHAFSGKVTEVSKGSRPDGPSYLLVGKFEGTVPPNNTVLIVLNERNEKICEIKVVRQYHYSDNEDLPVEEIGCTTVDELPTNPVTKGDKVVWIKADEKEPEGTAGGE